jgi:hypothetical protein
MRGSAGRPMNHLKSPVAGDSVGVGTPQMILGKAQKPRERLNGRPRGGNDLEFVSLSVSFVLSDGP